VVLYIDIETRDLAMSKIKKVLIIEDNDCLLRLMDHYFGKRYTVFPTRNGLDAMRYLNDGILPDIILLDWDMPVMGGEMFLEGLKTSSFFKDIPVIVISGSKPMEEFKNIEANSCFEKPFDPRKLNAQIQSALSEA